MGQKNTRNNAFSQISYYYSILYTDGFGKKGLFRYKEILVRPMLHNIRLAA
jgi:hypothetical protein